MIRILKKMESGRHLREVSGLKIRAARLRLQWNAGRIVLGVLAVMVLSTSTSAQQDPPGCSVSGAMAVLFVNRDEARHGEELCVWVEVSNTCSACCSAEANVEITLGDDITVPIIQNAWISRGDYFICPSEDSRCLVPSNCTIDGMQGYRFDVDHFKEHESIVPDCPPSPRAGWGCEDVALSFSAISHRNVEVGYASCASLAIPIRHDPCDGTCSNGEFCILGICVPRGCNRDGLCSPGEDCSLCQEDCAGLDSGCGNGVCEPSFGENCLNCPADCNGHFQGKRSGQFCCGADAQGVAGGCEDHRCTTRGFDCSDEPVSSCCGDEVCSRFENGCNCRLDCGPAPDYEIPGLTCADHVDNDCDGLADHEDLDCPCEGRGGQCASSADCCSGICTGRGVCR